MCIKIYSFFSGLGFLDLGFEDEGFDIVFVNEYNKSFLDAYKYARKKMNYNPPKNGYYQGSLDDLFRGKLNEELTRNVKSDKEEGLVGFIGGPPCPDFSVAGKNAGITGENGRLTESYKRIILKHEPDFFLFENVKGLWSTQKHREEYERIKRAFVRKGYILIDKLINSLEYGVPQERERVLLFGIRKDVIDDERKSAKKYLMNNFKWNSNLFNIENIKLLNWPNKTPFQRDALLEMPDNIQEELTVEYWFRKNDVYMHPNANDYFRPVSIRRFETIEEGDVSKKSFKRLHRWRFSPTVAYGNNEVHLHPYKERRLSVAEALAIQSLPKEFEVLPTLSLSEKFKMIGNGVPYLVAKETAYEIKKFLQENEERR